MKWKQWVTVLSLAVLFSISLGISAKTAGSGKTMETAVQISIGAGAKEGTLKEETTEEYWYKFRVPANIGNQWVKISGVNKALEDSMDISIMDEDGAMLDNGSMDAGESYELFCKVADSGMAMMANYDYVVEPGKTYYIQLSGYFSYNPSNGFHVELTTMEDDNWGTLERAAEIALDAEGSGTLEWVNDADYFQFTLPEDEKLYRITVNTSYNCEIKVLDEMETELNFLSANEDDHFSDYMEITSSGGAYYLVFEGVGVDSGKAPTTYDFKVFLSPDNVEEEDIGDAVPEPTKKPVATQKPAATAKPVATQKPEATTKPEPTEASEETSAPEVTMEPGISVTEQPGEPVPVEPIITEGPSESLAPAVTKAPVASMIPVTDLLEVGTIKKIGKIEYQVTELSARGGKVSVYRTGNQNSKSITIPSTVEIFGVSYPVTKISDGAFMEMDALETVKLGSNVESIGARAFEGCKKLEFVLFPKKVSEIGQRAFFACKRLHFLVIKSNQLQTVGAKSFLGTHMTMKVKVPKQKLKTYRSILKNRGNLSELAVFLTSPKMIRYEGVNY